MVTPLQAEGCNTGYTSLYQHQACKQHAWLGKNVGLQNYPRRYVAHLRQLYNTVSIRVSALESKKAHTLIIQQGMYINAWAEEYVQCEAPLLVNTFLHTWCQHDMVVWRIDLR